MSQTSMYFGAIPKLFEFAKELRNKMTPAELFLWEALRKNKLGVRFKPQHPLDRYIADFYCHKVKLVIEVDGETHDKQLDYDIGRSHELENYGIKVIRFTNQHVINNRDEVITIIKKIDGRCNSGATPYP